MNVDTQPAASPHLEETSKDASKGRPLQYRSLQNGRTQSPKARSNINPRGAARISTRGAKVQPARFQHARRIHWLDGDPGRRGNRPRMPGSFIEETPEVEAAVGRDTQKILDAGRREAA